MPQNDCKFTGACVDPPHPEGVFGSLPGWYGQMRHWFGSNYYPRLAILNTINNGWQNLDQKIRNIADSIAITRMNNAITIANNLFNNANTTIQNINSNLKNRMDNRDDKVRDEFAAADEIQAGYSAGLHANSIAYTDASVAQSDNRTDGLLGGLRNEINNRFSWTNNARSWITSGQANVPDFTRSAFEEFLGIDIDNVNEFISNPISFILDFLLNNILELIVEASAEAFSTVEQNLPNGKFL